MYIKGLPNGRPFILSIIFYLLRFFQTVRIGEAMKIEEYVPKMIPSVNARLKWKIDSAPSRTRATKVNSVEIEVFNDRAIV